MASNVYDPFLDIVNWLEGLARGETKRLTIDVEGSEIELSAWALNASLLRFSVASSWREARDILLDVAIDRRVLVASLYEPLLRYWEGP